MKKLMTLLFLLASFLSYSQKNKVVLPVAEFTANFCNFPYAWTASKGEGVQLNIIDSTKKENSEILNRIQELAPATKIQVLTPNQFYKKEIKNQAILQYIPIKPAKHDKFLQRVKELNELNSVVILPAWFGPMEKGENYEEHKKFLSAASKVGAIITGCHGTEYQLGDLNFWGDLPIDIFALNKEVMGGRYGKPGTMIDKSMQKSSLPAAAAVCLLKSNKPKYNAADIKGHIRKHSRKVNWSHIKVTRKNGKEWETIDEHLDKKVFMEKIRKRREQGLDVEIIKHYSGNCLDASFLLELPPFRSGEWRKNASNIAEVQRKATGKGVTVAILDWLFDKEDPVFKDRIVSPYSVIKDKDVFWGQGHGTWMAKELVKVAPEVKIMPVRIIDKEQREKQDEFYVQGIRYAADQGADIVTISHPPVKKENQEKLDEALKYAKQHNTTVVYIHYYGNVKGVIPSCPIEFANSKYIKEPEKRIFVIGTNDYYKYSFPYTWGFSQTAPFVGGIIALMLDIEPSLKPEQIHTILKRSFTETREGYHLLDAGKAVKML